MTERTKTDAQIERDVLAELAWDPEVDTAGLGVAVDEGVVTLTGAVESLPQRLAAERAARRVEGVRAAANEVVVETPEPRTDAELTQAVTQALAADVVVPRDRIRVSVRDGRVTLEGEVEWRFQRRAADEAARNVPGVTGVVNLITVRPPREAVLAGEIKDGIEQALVRNAEVEAARIRVRVEGGHVTLTGAVRLPHEREEAEAAAWRAQGVTSVTNLIEIEAQQG